MFGQKAKEMRILTLPACAERSKFAGSEFRVRGLPRVAPVEGAPHPNPLPRRAGEGVRKPLASRNFTRENTKETP